METARHRHGGDHPEQRRPRRAYPVAVLTVTVPRADYDEVRALIFAAAERAGMNATQWAASRLIAAARAESAA